MTPELEDSNQRVKSIIFQANLKLFGVTGMKTHIVSNKSGIGRISTSTFNI